MRIKYIYKYIFFSGTKNRFRIVWRHRVLQWCRSGPQYLYCIYFAVIRYSQPPLYSHFPQSLSLSSSIVGSVYNFYVLYYIFRLFFRSWGLFFVNDDVYQYTRGIRSKWLCPVNRTLNYNIYTVAAAAHEIISITFGDKCQNSRYLYKSFKFCNALTFRSLAIYFIIQNICSQLSR